MHAACIKLEKRNKHISVVSPQTLRKFKRLSAKITFDIRNFVCGTTAIGLTMSTDGSTSFYLAFARSITKALFINIERQLYEFKIFYAYIIRRKLILRPRSGDFIKLREIHRM